MSHTVVTTFWINPSLSQAKRVVWWNIRTIHPWCCWRKPFTEGTAGVPRLLCTSPHSAAALTQVRTQIDLWGRPGCLACCLSVPKIHQGKPLEHWAYSWKTRVLIILPFACTVQRYIRSWSSVMMGISSHSAWSCVRRQSRHPVTGVKSPGSDHWCSVHCLGEHRLKVFMFEGDWEAGRPEEHCHCPRMKLGGS